MSEALRKAARELSYELDGVIADVEHGNGFDAVCLQTIKRVRDALAALSTSEPTDNQISCKGILDNLTPEPSRCVVTGNPCGTDTVPRGKQCPSESGVCVHRPSREPTQEQVDKWVTEIFRYPSKPHKSIFDRVEFRRADLYRFATLAHAAGFEAGRMAGGKEQVHCLRCGISKRMSEEMKCGAYGVSFDAHLWEESAK
jgi:hypothetical protein